MNNRQTGKRWERWFSTKLRDIFPLVQRNANEQSQLGGLDLKNTHPFGFEIKGGKAYRSKMIRKILDQVELGVEKEGSLEYAVALIKPLREEPYIIMTFKDFKKLISKNEWKNS